MISNLGETPIYAHDGKETQLQMLNANASIDPGSEKILENDFKLLVLFFAQSIERQLSGEELSLKTQAINSFENTSKSYLSLGIGWVSHAILFLNGYITNIPIDPVELRRRKLYFIETELSQDLSMLHVVRDVEYLRNGKLEETAYKDELLNRIERKIGVKSKLAEKIPIRPEVSQIDLIHSELLYLKNEVLNIKKIQALINDFQLDSDASEDLLLEEEALQNLLWSVTQRMKSAYPLYLDFTGPIITAIKQFQHGLRYLRAHFCRNRSLGRNLSGTLLDCLKLPTVSELKEVARTMLNISPGLLLNLVAKMLPTVVTTSLDEKESLEFMLDLFHQLIDYWKEVNSQENMNQDDDTEVPVFHDHTAEFDVRYQESVGQLSPSCSDNKVKSFKGSVYRLFLHLCNSLNTIFSKEELITSLNSAFDNIYRSMSDCRDEVLGLVGGDDTEKCIRAGILLTSRKHLVDLKSSNLVRYDFYNDANISEARLISPVLLSVYEKLECALENWPEHTILQTLSGLVTKLISMPMTTPLIKLLVGLEILMVKTDEWEAYAAVDFSLRKPLDQIINLIVRWRKLELESWSELLAVEDRKCQDRVSAEFPSMWQVTVGSLIAEQSVGTINKGQLTEEMQENLTEYFNRFIHSGKMGEFVFRLELVNAFCLLLRKLCDCKVLGFSRILLNILENLNMYYHQFKPSVLRCLEDSRAPLQQELSEFVKIASWKDINVYALKESAKRSHYQLVKIVKKYQLTLLSPIGDKLQLDTLIPTTGFSESSTSRQIIRFYRGVLVYETLLPYSDFKFSQETMNLCKSKKISSTAITISKSCFQDESNQSFLLGLDSILDEILQTIKDYSNHTINDSDNIQKGAKSIRRKSWVDLLKFLAHIGLNPFGHAKYGKYRDRSTLFKNPIIPVTNHIPELSDTLQKAQEYFFKVLALSERLNVGLGKRSEDVTHKECSNAFSYFLHLLSIADSDRTTISISLTSFSKLQSISDLFVAYFGDELAAKRRQFVKLRHWHQEFSRIYSTFASARLVEESLPASTTKINWIQCVSDDFDSLKLKCDAIVRKFKKIGADMVLPVKEITDCVLESIEFVDSIRKHISSTNHDMKWLFTELSCQLERFIELSFFSNEVPTNRQILNFEAFLDQLLGKMMVIFQSLNLKVDNVGREQMFEFSKDSLYNTHNVCSKNLNTKLLAEVSDDLNLIMENLFTNEENEKKFECLLQLLDQLVKLAKFRICERTLLHRMLMKFSLVLTNTFVSVIEKGFCIPEESEENSTINETGVDGTGVGEGEAQKDVSNEIEDQSELDGMRNDDDNELKDLKNEKNGIEMEDDFEGALEDVSIDGDNLSDAGKENELDEQMGDLDDELADAIDEKLWDGDEQDTGKERYENDSKLDPSSVASEMVAEEQNSDGGATPKDLDQPEGEMNENEFQDGEDKVNEAAEAEENLQFHPSKDGEIDEGESADDEVEAGESNRSDTEDPEKPKQSDLIEKPESPSEEEYASAAEGEDAIDEKDPTEVTLDEGEAAEDEYSAPESETLDKNEVNKVGEKDTNDEIQDTVPGLQSGLDSDDRNSGPSNASKQNDGGDDNGQDINEASNYIGLGGKNGNEFDPGQKEEKIRPSTSQDPNPHRSIGSALQEWMSRLQDIKDAESKGEDMLGIETGKDLEYVMENEEVQNYKQALGAATLEQQAEMEKLAISGETDEADVVAVEDNQKEPEIEETKEKGTSSKHKSEVNQPENLDRVSNEEIKTQSQLEVNEGGSEIIENRESFLGVARSHADDTDSSMEYDGADNYEELRQTLEKDLISWQAQGSAIHSAIELWKRYSTLTRDYSFHLCEQLRLILEPTLTSKLKGDYKSGKRLNMRKIIPYIASNFKKDKIWMKRSKPSKRTYQILLSIDDSRSMASSHSVQLAFESLALIINAFNQLEVGELGIMSFGETTKLLHSFDCPWTDEEGARVMHSFSFKQERTKVRLLMDHSLQVLNVAKLTQRVADLWQLQIIISDGICEDHSYIRRSVLSAMEERIATVFIILDTRSPKDSIMNMSNVSYEIDTSKNTPTLKMTSYMETFPFDYFVLVTAVEDLPEVLSDVLRQFFSFTKDV